MDADENEFLPECLKIHGYITSSEDGSDGDVSKSELDKRYENYKPPLFKIDPAKQNVIVIDQSDSEDECNRDKNFSHLGTLNELPSRGFDKMNFDADKILTQTSDLQQGWTTTLSKRQRRTLRRRGTSINSEFYYDQSFESLKPPCTNIGNNSLDLGTKDFDLDNVNLNSKLGTENSKEKVKTQQDGGGGTFQINDRTCNVGYSTLPDDFVIQSKPKVRRRKKKKNHVSKETQGNLGNDFTREDIRNYKSEEVTPSPSVEYPLYGYGNNAYENEPCNRLVPMSDNIKESEDYDENGSIKINKLGQIYSDNKTNETETWYDQIFENREPNFSNSENLLWLENVADVKSANDDDINVKSRLRVQKSDQTIKTLEEDRAGSDFPFNDQNSTVFVGSTLSDRFVKSRSKNRSRKKRNTQTENCELSLGINFTREVINIRNYKSENFPPGSAEYPLYSYDKCSYNNCKFCVNVNPMSDKEECENEEKYGSYDFRTISCDENKSIEINKLGQICRNNMMKENIILGKKYYYQNFESQAFFVSENSCFESVDVKLMNNFGNISVNSKLSQSKISEENLKAQENNNELNDIISNMVSSSVLPQFVKKSKSKRRKKKKQILKECYGQGLNIQNFEDINFWDNKTYSIECEYCDTGTMADYYLIDTTSEMSLSCYELPDSSRDFCEVLIGHIYDITHSVLRWTSSQILIGIWDSFIFRNPVNIRPTPRAHNFDTICFLLFDNFNF